MSKILPDSEEKINLHPRSLHRGKYDFKALAGACPELAPFIILNKYGQESVNYFNPVGVKMLNKALLKHFYQIDYWDIPDGYLCPPIPGRVDYIHYLADLLPNPDDGKIVSGNTLTVLDIGTGANCIYPLLGNKVYGWKFIASEVDDLAYKNAFNILNSNGIGQDLIEIRKQADKNKIFKGIIKPADKIDFSMCNPPFHASQAEANTANLRKVRNLKGKKPSNPQLNFSGSSHFLWYKGCEYAFIEKMIQESTQFKDQVRWFTTLVSKESNLQGLKSILKKINPSEYKTIEMAQGQKKSRLLAWRF
ncbi:MAG: 23S rRNA (adenine(1618)-N(6))-methyltransferase RlmF [Saprospiraceae bacterium]|nr:23S rRNA (adenine(1618)-N(6))-methyltransferase RlmF [Saprospiraceae bacterium]